ncbi:hypothetical protein [Streptomyces sp. NPDC003247]|uniref:hypothetical protein n=1 Tax=Streptomyces sp. NPDC003247 TaxID=3364677 RepID=UPI0036B26F7A
MTAQPPNPGSFGPSPASGGQGTPPGHVPHHQNPWGTPPPAFPPGRPTAPARRRGWLVYGVIPFVALLVGVGIGSSGEDGTTDGGTSGTKAAPGPTVTVTKAAKNGAEPGPTVTETVTAKPKETKEAGPATSFSGEGEYLVGEDIKPGTYKTAGPEDEFGCYWERAKDASGEFDSIIANNNLNGPGRVTLNKGEYFKTNRCQEWKKVG